MTANLAFADYPEVAVLQDSYSVSISFRVEHFNRPVLAALFGPPPLVMLWWDMSELYRPFWFLQREDH